jgi:hypothetical protein
MNLSFQPWTLDELFPLRRRFIRGCARPHKTLVFQKAVCGLLLLSWPAAASFTRASSSSQSSSPSSQDASAPSPSPPQAQSASPGTPPQKEDSPAEAARKAKANKPPAAKGKVYTEEDLASMNGHGVSVVGEEPKKGAPSKEPKGAAGGSTEEYWRGRAQEILGEIAAVDESILQKKEEIKKYGSGGFDVTTGMKDNIAYIRDRNGQLQRLEKRKADLEKKLDDLQEEGRKAGASPAWFR